MDPPVIDAVDRQIIHALTIEPRASFRALGDVTGVSDQTAARRYRRLQELVGLRVLARVDGAKVGWVDWYLRAQCFPGAAGPIADALARRADTSWVVLASGGTEIVCALRERSPEQRDALLLEGLPGSRRVVHLSAHALLFDYSAPAWAGLTGALAGRDLAPLAPVLVEPVGSVTLSGDDEALVGYLAGDGRASVSAVALPWVGTSPPCGAASANCGGAGLCTSTWMSTSGLSGCAPTPCCGPWSSRHTSRP
ncbi:MAG: AsnC family transcriptional regulator [Acidimicrobiales bacterium]